MKGLFGRSRIMSTDESLAVYRESGAPDYVDGKAVPKPPITFLVAANVQPLTGLELMRVPELDRALERFTIYTGEVEKPLLLNDRILRSGLYYQVENLETWGAPPNGYQKAQIVRIDVGPYTASTGRLDEPNGRS